MLKIAKKAAVIAERNWQCVFSEKKWSDLIPKDMIPSLEALPIPKIARPRSLTDYKHRIQRGELKDKMQVLEIQKSLEVPSQVEFLYSLWEKAPKGTKRNLEPIKRKPKPEKINLEALDSQNLPNASHGSTFYKINHSRNKVTKSYNYVVRKNNTQFVCQEKETELLSPDLHHNQHNLVKIDEIEENGTETMSRTLAVNKVDIRISDSIQKLENACEINMRSSIRNFKLAKIQNGPKDLKEEKGFA